MQLSAAQVNVSFACHSLWLQCFGCLRNGARWRGRGWGRRRNDKWRMMRSGRRALGWAGWVRACIYKLRHWSATGFDWRRRENFMWHERRMWELSSSTFNDVISSATAFQVSRRRVVDLLFISMTMTNAPVNINVFTACQLTLGSILQLAEEIQNIVSSL